MTNDVIKDLKKIGDSAEDIIPCIKCKTHAMGSITVVSLKPMKVLVLTICLDCKKKDRIKVTIPMFKLLGLDKYMMDNKAVIEDLKEKLKKRDSLESL